MHLVAALCPDLWGVLSASPQPPTMRWATVTVQEGTGEVGAASWLANRQWKRTETEEKGRDWDCPVQCWKGIDATVKQHLEKSVLR